MKSGSELIEKDFAQSRRRVLVIEPHADDAARNLGATLWRRRHECEFTVATMASRSNFTQHYYHDRECFSVDEVVTTRNAESRLFAQMIGGHHLPVGLNDAPLRYFDGNWSLDYYRKHRVAIAVATQRDADPAELRRWIAAARRLLALPGYEEVWFPQGSPHGDHRLTNKAFLAALQADRNLIGLRTIRIYQDTPTTLARSGYGEDIADAMRASGYKLDEEHLAVGETLADKLRLVSIYASQPLSDLSRSAGKSYAGPPDAASVAERIWTLRELPPPAADWRRHVDTPLISRSARVASDWLRRTRFRKNVRILLLIPSGRWAADLKVLLALLPSARFDLFASPSAIAEISDAGICDGRVKLRRIDAGRRAWGILAMRLAITPGIPTIFLAGENKLHEASWLSSLWPFTDTLIVSSMDTLVRAADDVLFDETIAA